MSNYTNGRRAPNVSQYLANLNTVPSAQDIAAQDFALPDDGLDFLTNAEFFDFDNFNVTTDFAPPAQKPAMTNSTASHTGLKAWSADQSTDQAYQFGEFQTYPSSVAASPSIASPQNGIHGAYPPQAHALAYQAGDKRKASVVDMGASGELDESSRAAVDEDKRRRNTAASARFRVKKKQREQALEKSAKEMSDKVAALESKVQQLEMENKWLKGLITEKGDTKIIPSFDSESTEKKSEERSTSSRTDGVGTKNADA
ncbi:regulatory protein cys-3/bZIP transcription factor (MetR) [Acrodontium crateriforme]|uniref:Regulatory protein cys-3/bZIP transcription factor (MetR) n=1 Tax=Acrodontium crateriforme TaxID=150365 RepID=A0AAQ3M264_9PEZI|nr:regulatory protein cys-3/bZIP transcription factor (MetR) [Acrodontium crateriforme]